MSQAIRQSELFAGNNWLAIYRAFTEVNLNSYDFNTIRESMVDYIRRHYSEDFNDWIHSSEFVALIDLLAYMGQSLAFRIDINARENFIDLARRRESILRIARSLSYNAKRNYPARGFAKLTEIKTTHDVYDSNGRNLNNVVIRWDDPTNPDWFEQWILVLNSSLIPTNPFGRALETINIDGVQTQYYRLNNIQTNAGNYPFNADVNGRNVPFDVVNPKIDKIYGITEQEPNPNGSFHIIYRNDGNGNSSKNTGFFVYIKQGTLMKSDLVINEPQENRTILINTPNINETDVWVQSVNDNGAILPNGSWERVGFTPTDEISKIVLSTENITYNGIDPDIQNIYQVITQEDDKILLRFGDGRFGRSPSGLLRVWYRVSLNENIIVRPEDIRDTQISVHYNTTNNIQKTLTLSFSIQESLMNGITSETNDEIRRRASRVASSQGRMVSGSDYNALPLQTNLIAKMKAVNRVYSGQSRYIDLNDPTGTYQNVNVFSDDGSIYKIDDNQFAEVSHDLVSVDEIITRYITNMVNSYQLLDFVRSKTTDIEFDSFTTAFLSDPVIRDQIYENVSESKTFGIGFDFNEESWVVINSDDINPNLSDDYELTGPTSWLIYCEYTPQTWRFVSRGLAYVFESDKSCRFYFVKDYKGIDPQTGKSADDVVKVLRKPNALHIGSNAISSDISLKINDSFFYNDGYLEPKRVKFRYDESNPVNVNQFLSKLKTQLDSNIVVHRVSTSMAGYREETIVRRINPIVDILEPNEIGYTIDSSKLYFYIGKSSGVNEIMNQYDNIDPNPGTVWVYYNYNEYRFIIREGITGIVFQWKHYAPSDHRIDPSVSNIIDMLVLPMEYYNSMITWGASGYDPENKPKAPSEVQMKMLLQDLEKYKMFSDEIIWRPAKFKLLFGETADPYLRAKFKVVKMVGTTMSDGEIKSKIVESIKEFFNINYWNFGDTFYFSELSAYIHRQLSTTIASIEIVPVDGNMQFGDLREISSQPDEIFFPTTQVGDIEIINANTAYNLRIQKW